MSRSRGSRRRSPRRLDEVMASLKGQGLSILISELNEGHIADLLARAFRIERGAVAAV